MPDIDSVWTDKATYPYAFIQTTTNGGACLRLSSAIPYNDGTYIRGENINYSEYDFFAGRTNWEFYRTTTNYTGPFFVINNSLWASADILNSNNSVFLAASDPIPLDGYNVIEWDGDTSDLPVGTVSFLTQTDNIYRVSNVTPISVGDKIVSVGGDSPLVVEVDNSILSTGSSFSAISNALISGFAGSYSYDVGGTVFDSVLPQDGIYFSNDNGYFISLFAYRSTETPPDEGGGDDDDPQPPPGG